MIVEYVLCTLCQEDFQSNELDWCPISGKRCCPKCRASDRLEHSFYYDTETKEEAIPHDEIRGMD